MSMKFPTVPSKRLAESINGSATSFKVSDLEGWDGADISSSTFGTELYVVFRNSANTLMEIMKVDPATITTAASAITISLRGLKFDGDLATEVSANKLTWVKGDTIVEFGSNPGQIFQWLKEYIDGIAIAGSPDASTTAKGIVEEATNAEVLAKTTAGSTSARLFVNPSTMASTLLSDYKVDTGAADAYVITPVPAITAYTVGQRFTFKAVNTNTGASTINVNGLGVKSIKKIDGATALAAGDIRSGQIVEVEYDGTNFQILSLLGNAPANSNLFKFGGTGADGALTVSSGTTNIDLGGAEYFEKNYTTISITGTGAVTFSNPHTNGTIIVLKATGAVTLTSSATPMLDASGMGAAGAVGETTSANESRSGGGGQNGQSFIWRNGAGGGGTASSGGGTQSGGIAGTLPTTVFHTTGNKKQIASKYAALSVMGSGGGSGGVTNQTGTATAPDGGRGGGVLIIECAGAWNFTTTSGISVAGKTPSGGVTSATGSAYGGSGGGGGGTFIGLYGSLVANTGTVTVSGGTAGGGANNGSMGGRITAGGGGGASWQAGNAASSASANTPGSGAAGADGYSLIAANTEFA